MSTTAYSPSPVAESSRRSAWRAACGGRPHVLLVNTADWLSAAQLPRLFHRAGFRVSVLARPGTPITLSRYVGRMVPHREEVMAFAEALRHHLAGHLHEYAMIVLADEPAVETLAALPEKSWLRPWFPVDPESPGLDMLRGKVHFVPACVSAGVPVPAFRVVHDGDGLAAAAGALGFPLVIKGNQGFAGASVRRAENLSELRAHYAVLRGAQPSSEDPFLVQRFITGGVVSTQMVLDHGRPLCWNSALKAETHPGPFGPSCVRRLISHPEIGGIVKAIGAMIEFHGLCGFDWMHEAGTGKAYVLELHARQSPGLDFARFAGVDLGGALRALALGKTFFQSPRVPPHTPPTLYMFPNHLQRCMADLDWRSLRHWLPGAALHDIPWDEPRLLLHGLRKTLFEEGALGQAVDEIKRRVRRRLGGDGALRHRAASDAARE